VLLVVIRDQCVQELHVSAGLRFGRVGLGVRVRGDSVKVTAVRRCMCMMCANWTSRLGGAVCALPWGGQCNLELHVSAVLGLEGWAWW
jgi:hypothetical protein